MSQRVFSAIGFDYNGTLLRDAPNFYKAVCVSVFDRYGKRRPSFEEFREEIGRGPQQMCADRGINEPWETLQGYVSEYYAAQEHSRLSVGALTTLRGLKKACVPMGLITALQAFLLEEELQRHPIERYFPFIRSSSHVKVDAILECCEVFSCEPSSFIYIGDTRQDIIDAHTAGCFAVAYTKGYGSIRSLYAESPDLVVHSWKEFREQMRSYILFPTGK